MLSFVDVYFKQQSIRVSSNIIVIHSLIFLTIISLICHTFISISQYFYIFDYPMSFYVDIITEADTTIFSQGIKSIPSDIHSMCRQEITKEHTSRRVLKTILKAKNEGLTEKERYWRGFV